MFHRPWRLLTGDPVAIKTWGTPVAMSGGSQNKESMSLLEKSRGLPRKNDSTLSSPTVTIIG